MPAGPVVVPLEEPEPELELDPELELELDPELEPEDELDPEDPDEVEPEEEVEPELELEEIPPEEEPVPESAAVVVTASPPPQPASRRAHAATGSRKDTESARVFNSPFRFINNSFDLTTLDRAHPRGVSAGGRRPTPICNVHARRRKVN